MAAEEQKQEKALITTKEQYNALRSRVEEGALDNNPALKQRAVKHLSNFHNQYRQQQVQDFASRIDTTPVEREPTSTFRGGGTFAPGGVTPAQRARSRGDREKEQRNADLSTKLQNAAEAGVDVESGAPVSARGVSGLLRKDPQAAAQSLEYKIGKELEEAGVELPPGVPAVFQDEHTGRLAYWRPLEDGSLKPTLVDPAGVDAGDAIELAPGALTTLAEMGAAMSAGAAGLVGAGPKGAAVAGATGIAATSQAANTLRRELARKAGVPDEIVDQITNDDILHDSLVAAGFELAAPAMVGGVRMLMNRKRPIDVTPERLDEIRGDIDEVLKASARIKERTDVTIVPSAGGVTGDPSALAAEATARRVAVGKRSKELIQKDAETNLGLSTALSRILERSAPGAPVSSAPETAQRGQALIRRPAEVAGERAREAQRSAEDLYNSVADVPDRRVYTATRENILAEADQAIAQERTAWEAFDEMVQFDPKTGRSNVMLANPEGAPIRTALEGLEGDSARALSESIAQSQRKLAQDLGLPDEAAEEGLRLAGDAVDMRQLHRLQSHLRREKRLLDNNVNNLGWRSQDINRVLEAIKEQSTTGDMVRRDGMRMFPDDTAQIAEVYNKARNASFVRHDTFDRASVRNLTEQRADGSFVVPEGTLGQTLLKPGNGEILADAMSAAGHNPQVKAGLLRELERKYINEVMPEGRHSEMAHRRFLQEYSDHINMLAGEDKTGLIRNAADIGALAQRRERKAKVVQDALSRVYGRSLSSNDLYGGNIVRDVMSKELTLDQTKAIRRRISNADPELWGDILRHGREHLSNQMATKAGLKPNITTIDRVLDNQGDRLGVLYGKEYTDNLKDLRDVMSAWERTKLSGSVREELQTPILRMFRVTFGPLGREQRFITAANEFLRKGSQNALVDLATSPQRLDAFVKLGKMNPSTIGFIQAATAFGMGIEQMPQEAQDTVQRLQNKNPEALEDLLRRSRETGQYVFDEEETLR